LGEPFGLAEVAAGGSPTFVGGCLLPIASGKSRARCAGFHVAKSCRWPARSVRADKVMSAAPVAGGCYAVCWSATPAAERLPPGDFDLSKVTGSRGACRIELVVLYQREGR